VDGDVVQLGEVPKAPLEIPWAKGYEVGHAKGFEEGFRRGQEAGRQPTPIAGVYTNERPLPAIVKEFLDRVGRIAVKGRHLPDGDEVVDLGFTVNGRDVTCSGRGTTIDDAHLDAMIQAFEVFAREVR